jgi:hypothetical protein
VANKTAQMDPDETMARFNDPNGITVKMENSK